MMKRHLAIFVALVLLISAIPLYVGAADSDFEVQNGVLMRYNGKNGIVSVPNTVKEIGKYAFSKNSYISKVILPDSVTTIGEYAFSECPALTSVVIGSKVTVIGLSAFMDCYFLKEMNIPDSVEVIGAGAFANCYSLPGIKFGDGLMSIGARAFSMCLGFKTINIPSNLIAIGFGAFSGCVNLENYTVSEDNKDFAVFDGVLYSKDGKTLVAYPQKREGAYTLRAGTVTIGAGAFSYAIDLTGLAGTGDVEFVEVSAFEYCISLRDIYLPKALLINDYAFNGCESLKTARLGGANVGQYSFAECPMLNTVIISEGSELINDFAFGWCPMLADLVLPSTIQLIGNNVFSYTPKDTRILCEVGSAPHRFFSSFGMVCEPLPKASDWALELLEAADRFAVANLQIGYKENATRHQFTLAVANFLEQYYNKKVDTLAKERGFAVGKFSDTEDMDILLVNALKLVNGTGEGKFSPDALLTREQAATLMYRIMIDILGEPEPEPEPEEPGEDAEEPEESEESEEVIEAPEPEPKYKDAAKISSWALDAVNAMTDAGIMVGDGANFNPQDPCTREMCIIMFARLWNTVNAK
ncbi:MAG: leucine-rich repeat protein [Oscillospiraceae bacterium]|nr:leucine-rich repeat protein [Oscillospiraceae bacterium]